jgi:fatty acid desaturase
MSTTPVAAAPQFLYQRALVRSRDERVFLLKLTVLAILYAAGGALALQRSLWIAGLGIFVLGAAYTHAVELQHQCLHHSAFRWPRPHRWVGVPLGLPLLVVYSHYRVRHLQHHRYLGTLQDTEFFGFDTRQPLTFRAVLRGFFDITRLWAVGRNTLRCVAGTWNYDMGQIAPRSRSNIVNEYRLLAVFLAAIAAVGVTGGGEFVLRLWLLPFTVAMPMHFLIELPEHILCDVSSTDVLHNTRSITGGWFSTWFTNGNNLHIEHHAAMNVPLNRLSERHNEVQLFALNVERTYASFYTIVAREIRANRSKCSTRESL